MSIHGGAQAHFDAFIDATRRLRHDPVRHSVGVLVMAIMLALPGVSWVALRGLDLLIPVEALTPGISVFANADVTDDAFTALADELNQTDGVVLVEFISSDRGLAALSDVAGLTELTDAFEENPLPDVLRVLLGADVHRELSQTLALKLEADPRVEFVRIDQASAMKCEMP